MYETVENVMRSQAMTSAASWQSKWASEVSDGTPIGAIRTFD